MKLLWLCNLVPGRVRQAMGGSASGCGLWVDSVLDGLMALDGMEVRVLCPGDGRGGDVNESCSYGTFSEGLPYVYLPALEKQFREELEHYRPDVIHIWGTEYGHTLAMVNAAEQAGRLDSLVVSIQGLCSVLAGHYLEGVPERVQRGCSFRDFVRRDNLKHQQEKFARRGALEQEALRKVRHVIGRTDWDFACTRQLNPDVRYHFCNETLRKPFYEGQWRYDRCQKHRIFASSFLYPLKGFHYLLQAMGQIVKTYPDVTLAVPGESFFTASRLRRTNYQKYLADLARQNGLEDRIQFLGALSAEEMKQAYLSANVFVLPSTVENSPNSLGEAMLLGVPCVASLVGGVANLLTAGEEGFVYQSTAPYMLAHYVNQVFAMETGAAALGTAARVHARKTHDPEKNLGDLLEIYQKLS